MFWRTPSFVLLFLNNGWFDICMLLGVVDFRIKLNDRIKMLALPVHRKGNYANTSRNRPKCTHILTYTSTSPQAFGSHVRFFEANLYHSTFPSCSTTIYMCVNIYMYMYIYRPTVTCIHIRSLVLDKITHWNKRVKLNNKHLYVWLYCLTLPCQSQYHSKVHSFTKELLLVPFCFFFLVQNRSLFS